MKEVYFSWGNYKGSISGSIIYIKALNETSELGGIIGLEKYILMTDVQPGRMKEGVNLNLRGRMVKAGRGQVP